MMDMENILEVKEGKYVFRVYAPICCKCGSSHDIEVVNKPDEWYYYCNKCRRIVTYEELVK